MTEHKVTEADERAIEKAKGDEPTPAQKIKMLEERVVELLDELHVVIEQKTELKTEVIVLTDDKEMLQEDMGTLLEAEYIRAMHERRGQ